MRPHVDEEYKKESEAARVESIRLEKIAINNARIAVEAEDIIRDRMKSRVHRSQEKIAKEQAIVKKWDNIKFK